MSVKFFESLPRFYLVDFETYVAVDKIGNNVIATNHLGNPYPVFKAIEDGVEISEKEYEAAVDKALSSRQA